MKMFYCLFILLCVIFPMFAQTAIMPIGEGTVDNPYQISVWQNLFWLSSRENLNGVSIEEKFSRYYIQTADIQMPDNISSWNQGEGILPIGYSYFQSTFLNYPFSGTYDGQNYSISGVFIIRDDMQGAGFFGKTANAMLKNINLIDINVTGVNIVGGLVADNNGFIQNCSVSGILHGRGSVGGIFGLNTGQVSNSFFNINALSINDKNVVSPHALYEDQFDSWINNNKNLLIENYFSVNSSGDYLIENLADLKNMLAFADQPQYSFSLESDIDLSNNEHFHIPVFKGEFKGNNHVINHFTLISDFLRHVGFFAYVELGTISDLHLENVNVVGLNDFLYHSNGLWFFDEMKVGALVGCLIGNASNCSVNASVTGKINTGGLAGYVVGNITNCHSEGSVISYENVVGGLIGEHSSGLVQNSYSHSNVSDEELSHGGGLIGYININATVQNCFSTGNVNVEYGGGLAATNKGVISNCYTLSDIYSVTHSAGLVSYNHGTINNSYSSGTLNSNQGIIAGLIKTNYGTISNSFWDTEISQTANGIIDNGQGITINVYGKSSDEMKTLSTFTDAGWDFNSIWQISPFLNESYPSFIWQNNLDIDDPVTSVTSISPFKLNSAYPNPFNPTTTISFDVYKSSVIHIDLYNIKGQKVKTLLNECRTPGNYSLTWNGKDSNNNTCSSGIYFCRLYSGDNQQTLRLILLK